VDIVGYVLAVIERDKRITIHREIHCEGCNYQDQAKTQKNASPHGPA